jgi:hypothetical protein
MNKTMGSILTILVSTIVGFVVAVTFYTPAWNGYVQLPGVIVALVTAFISGATFLLCPRRPLIGKALALLLVVPSLWFAVWCVMGVIYPGHL